MSTLESMGAAAMLDAGLVGHPDQLACARASVSGLDGGGAQRALDLQVAGGLSARVRPDRGLDIAGAWFAGLPVAWLSRVGEATAAAPGVDAWTARFGGGLVTTCGMQNVGLPSEGHGQHGAFSSISARNVGAELRRASGQELELVVSGVVEEGDALDVHLRCVRQITTRTGRGLLTLSDTVTNLGSRSLPAPLLYHVNLGAPLWSPGGRVRVPPGTRTVPRDEDARVALDAWDVAPAPSAGAVERVFEHVLPDDPDAPAEIRVNNETVGLTATISWDRTTMPRVHQWVHPRSGVYVLGIEPANCSVRGRAVDRAEGRLPVLEPGESRTTSLQVAVGHTAGTGR